jgi:tetratricopeptide (TPR) repeat protein
VRLRQKDFSRENRCIGKGGRDMARAADHHLSQEEIDWLAVADPQESETDDDGRDVQNHLACCELCRRTLQASESRRQALSATNWAGRALRGNECPLEDKWSRLVAGLLLDSQAHDLLTHAAACDYCGSLLHRFSEDFSDTLTPQEQQTLRQLDSSQPEWRRQMANQLAEASRRPGNKWLEAIRNWWRQPSKMPGWAYAMAAIFVCAAVSVPVQVISLRNAPDRLLAAAYSERRPFELRFAGARYGPLTQQRAGDQHSRFDRPLALLEAEARIARHLANDPKSPAWLQAQARADLLEGRYDTAAHGLEQASRIRPDSGPILTDLASAYFLRAQAMDRVTDYGQAIRLLNRALDANPEDPIALFNRALVYERTSSKPLAIADWKHYLRIDSSSLWASEARRHLAALEQ